jgi:uncharacterized protein YbjQ (UPF0145 family)
MIGQGWPDWTANRVNRPGLAEIADRLRRPRAGAFTSALSVNEFAALRSVSFEPVGLVTGVAVFRFRSKVSCGTSRASSLSVLNRVPWLWRSSDARHLAVDRMRDECSYIGAYSVVGVRLTTRPFLGRTIEFSATGTAIRFGRASRLSQPDALAPFTTHLSGQECATLIGHGWRPAGLVMGHGATVRHEWRGVPLGSWKEIGAAASLVHVARSDARDELRREALRFPGATVLTRDMMLDLHKVRCRDEGHDHVAEAFILGTAILPIDREASADPARDAAPLTIMRLNGAPRRREAAS